MNTLPGMTPTSLYPKIAKAAGLSFEELIEKILSGATLDGSQLHEVPSVSPTAEVEAHAS